MSEDTNTSDTNGVKYDISGLEEKIIQQVEYYFGDLNLLKDKNLRELIKLEDGWIPLETVIKFNRLKVLSTDFGVITTALKKSSSQLMEISEDALKIRRTPLKPLPESDVIHEEDLISRTVCVKRFPENTTLGELQEFFKDKGNISNICMRKKFNSEDFKGSVYLTFATKEDVENFMEVKCIKYTVSHLHRERKRDYIKRKQKQFEEKTQFELKEKKRKLKEESKKQEEGQQFKMYRNHKEVEDSEELEVESSCFKRQAQDEADDRPAKQKIVDPDVCTTF